MAEDSSSERDFDMLSRSQSRSSGRSNLTIDSSRSTTSSVRRRGLLGKLETGVHSILRRFSRTRTTLTEMDIRVLQALTNFSREDVLKWHEKFLSECPNGYMTRKQFVANYKSLCPKADAERFARHVFRAFDSDRSNTVDFHEFMTGLSMTSANSSTREKLKWTFLVFDIDGNGLLTRRECAEVIESIARFNLSTQGETSAAAIEQTITAAKQSMMNIFDHAGSTPAEVLTTSQFVDGCLKDNFISQLLAPSGNAKLTNSHDAPITSP